jgi:hypothetical protein
MENEATTSLIEVARAVQHRMVLDKDIRARLIKY